jgi:glycosyltransferase involved in cell wall biosynthesis
VGALSAVPGRDVVVADGPQAFSDALLRLLVHPAEQSEVGRAGRADVETHHRWDRLAAQLEAIYSDGMAARGGRRLEQVAG